MGKIDADFINMISKMLEQNVYPPSFEPKKWRKYPYSNCYIYALDLRINEGVLIGDFINKRKTYDNSFDELLETINNELERLGFEVIKANIEDLLDEDGCFKILVKRDVEGMYTFYREDSDGTWSHKSAGELPTSCQKPPIYSGDEYQCYILYYLGY